MDTDYFSKLLKLKSENQDQHIIYIEGFGIRLTCKYFDQQSTETAPMTKC